MCKRMSVLSCPSLARWANVIALVVCSVIALLPHVSDAADTPVLPSSSVGMPVAIEQLVLPGSELEAAPITDKSKIVIRIDEVYPHGSAFRYDLVCYGLEPGESDLREFLRRKDGTATDDLPALTFKVSSLLPPGQIEPHGLSFALLPWLGGYRLLLVAGGLLWGAGLVWLLYPRRKKAAADGAAVTPPLSLADRLRPLVVEAMAGRLPPAKLAELERALVSYWRRKLGLEDLPPVEALATLRAHPEASPLVTQLEAWLHRPAGQQTVDVGLLLEPYRNIAPDELDGVPALTAGAAR